MGIPIMPNIVRSGIYRTISKWGSGLSDRKDTEWVGRISDALSTEAAEFDSDFSWVRSSCKSHIYHANSPLAEWIYRKLMIPIKRQDIISKARRWIGFRWQNQSGPQETERILYRRASHPGKFVYHMPVSTWMPKSVPESCIPLMNVYDVVPLIFRDTYSKKERNLFDKYISRADSIGSHFIVNAASTKHSFCCFYNIEPENVHVVQLGCPDPTNVTTPQFGGHSDGNEREKIFLYVSSAAQRRKNIKSVIRAFSSFRKKHGDKFTLKIVGLGTDQAVSAASAEGVCIDGVQGLGSVSADHLEELYRTSFCGLYLSLYEGFGLPVLECMRRGLPVICSNVSTMPEVAGNAALLVDPLDIASITAAMCRITEDLSLREDLVIRSKLRAEEFSWSNSTNELFKLYERLINNCSN